MRRSSLGVLRVGLLTLSTWALGACISGGTPLEETGDGDTSSADGGAEMDAGGSASGGDSSTGGTTVSGAAGVRRLAAR